MYLVAEFLPFQIHINFDHKNIIHYCGRPFQDKEEMNAILVKNWNSVVKPEDLVIFGGDFFVRRSMGFYEKKITGFYNSLNGKKICLRGNHDTENPWLEYYKSDSLLMNYKNRILFFRHLPPSMEGESWPKKEKGSIFVYGHIHEKTKNFVNTFNMSVENINYTPVHLDEVIRRVDEFKANVGTSNANKFFAE